MHLVALAVSVCFIQLLNQSTSLTLSMSRSLFRKVPQSKLGVSGETLPLHMLPRIDGVAEPNPSWFGNKANEPGNKAWTNLNWLRSLFHFSFAEYSNSHNVDFGVLRVMNDDLVQPNRGFGAHPHRDMEICTYIVEGKLTHQDSMDTKETLGRGAVQFMVRHPLIPVIQLTLCWTDCWHWGDPQRA